MEFGGFDERGHPSNNESILPFARYLAAHKRDHANKEANKHGSVQRPGKAFRNPEERCFTVGNLRSQCIFYLTEVFRQAPSLSTGTSGIFAYCMTIS